MTDDVKELLGRAFGQEPPLRIDRDEVLQQGRKRLRRRRVFEASSVVAAVVVAAVGAAWLTNLADSTPERMPPAATSTAPAPNGPELPLSPPPTTTTTTGTPSVSTDTSYPRSKVLPSGEKALQLTELLYDSSGVMATLTTVDPVPGGRQSYRGMPAFKITGDGAYLYEADVRGSEGPGFVQVAVDYAQGEVASCDTLPFAHTECTDRRVAGKLMVLARWDSIDGERRYIAFAVLADGTRIAALSSNTTKSDQKSGTKPDATRQPVLGGDDLCSLIAKSGFSVH